MPFEQLTSKNALLYATKAYENPECLTVDEFLEDYKRFKYIKRLCRKYLTTGQLNVRLFLNHIIALLNVFGPVATVRILFLKCDDASSYCIIKPFLLYLSVLPDVVPGIDGYDIVTPAIPSDSRICTALGRI